MSSVMLDASPESWTEAALREAIREILARALRLHPDEIDDDKTFDAYGLESLAAVELTADLEDLLDHPIDAEAALHHASIARLAAHLFHDVLVP